MSKSDTKLFGNPRTQVALSLTKQDLGRTDGIFPLSNCDPGPKLKTTGCRVTHPPRTARGSSSGPQSGLLRFSTTNADFHAQRGPAGDES